MNALPQSSLAWKLPTRLERVQGSSSTTTTKHWNVHQEEEMTSRKR
jgi:hypothetical protein